MAADAVNFARMAPARRAAFNSDLEQYGEESRAHAVAWAAVKSDYEKGDDGKWHPKD